VIRGAGRPRDRGGGACPSISERAYCFSGGSGNLISDDAREADYAAELFEKSRRFQNAIDGWSGGSRNTQENAEFSKAIAAEKRRSAGCW